MDLEELSMRLGSLERARASDMQKAAQQAFMDKYGSRISNNTSLGLIILNELNRKGIDTSAADEAVQEILDQLRMEATMLLDTIKDNMEQGSELLDKINDMQESVEAAAAATGADLSVPSEEVPAEVSEAEAGMMPEGQPSMEGMPTDAGMEGTPNMGPAPEEMPADAGMGEPPAEVPPEQTQESLPEGDVVSDARMKRIKNMQDNWGRTNEQKKRDEESKNASDKKKDGNMKEQRSKFIRGIVSDRRMKAVKKNVSTPAAPKQCLSGNIISACMGGY